MVKFRFKELILGLIVLSITLLICVIAVEFVARSLDPALYAKNRLYVVTDYSIFRYKADLDVSIDRPEFVEDISINSLGIRDFGYDYNSRGSKRVLFLGDSFIAAFQVPLEKSVTKLIETRLRRNHEYDVINMGLSGTGPVPQALLLAKEGIKYEPGTVVFPIYVGNDIDKLSIGTLGDVDLSIFDSDSIEDYYVPSSSEQKFKNFVFRHYFTYSYIQNQINIRKGLVSDKIFAETQILHASPNDMIVNNLEDLKRVLMHVQRYLDSKSINFMVVLIPTKHQVDSGKFDEIVSTYDLDISALNVTFVQDDLVSFASEEDIVILDLLPGFQEENVNNSLYFDIDGHWNEAGHELAARLIYEKLLKEGFVP